MVYLQDKVTSNLFGLAMAFFPALIIDGLLAEKIGSLTDNINKGKAMIIGTIICGISILAISTFNTVVMFSIVWTINSICSRIYDLSESGLYAQLNSRNNNGEVFGVYTFICNLGSMVGPLIGGFLYDSVSEKAPFYFNGIGMIISAILITLLLARNKPQIYL